MSLSTVQRQFHVSRAFLKMTRWGSYILVFLGVGIQLLWLADPPKNVEFGLVFFSAGTLFFWGLAFFGLRVVRNAPSYSIAVDKEGIRYLNARQSVLAMKWADLADVRERPSLQRLDLLDRQGCILRVEYQLEKFEELRAIILDYAKTDSSNLIPFTHKKTLLFHLFYVVMIALPIAGAYYFVVFLPQSDKSMYLGIGLLATCGLIAREYWYQVIGIDVTYREVALKYPFRSVKLDVSNISSVEIKDDFEKQSRIPFVVITLLSGKLYPIKNVGVEAIKLKAVFEKACGKEAG